MKKLFTFLVAVFCCHGAFAQSEDLVRAHEAINHKGDYAMVCGVIASVNDLSGSKESPIYLSFDKPYPNNDFTAIIYSKNRKNFDIEPASLTGYKACVYGKVRVYKGKAQIEVVKENQLALRPPK